MHGTSALMTQSGCAGCAIPCHIGNTPLFQQGGLSVVDGLLDCKSLKALLAESTSRRRSAVVNDVAISDAEEVRGGSPARRFFSAVGGQIQTSFYFAPGMISFLSQLVGSLVTPSGNSGTFTYYAREGDFLSLHRDVDSCDVAVITCLADTSNSDVDGGLLCAYPRRFREPLSRIRATPQIGALKIKLKIAQTIVMFGGIVPHAVTPIRSGQQRIVSVLCYRAPGA